MREYLEYVIGIFYSAKHGMRMEICDALQFITHNMDMHILISILPEKWLNHCIVFASAATHSLFFLILYVSEIWYPLLSNTQILESGVKVSKLCNRTGRSELMTSIYAVVRSRTTNIYIQPTTLIQEIHNVALKGNTSIPGGEEREQN